MKFNSVLNLLILFSMTIIAINSKFKRQSENQNQIENENEKLAAKNATIVVEEPPKKKKKHYQEDEDNNNNNNLQKTLEKFIEYQSIYKQIEIQISREKELRESVDLKLKQVDETERRIQKLYNEVNMGVKDKVDLIFDKYSQLEKSNYDLNQRVFILEKEKEKSQISRLFVGKGISSKFDSNAIEPDCINRNSCRICLEDPKCVWCSLEKRCKQGDMSGPYDGSCLSTFEYSTCSQNNCYNNKSCSQCIQNENCGWCSKDNKCIEGSSKGPIGIICKNGFVHKFNSQRCQFNRNFLN